MSSEPPIGDPAWPSPKSSGAEPAPNTALTSGGPPASGSVRPVPARLGRFDIVRVLGQGGMGTVYEARQDNPRRTVALKVIRPGHVSPELLRRFGQEAQLLGRLQHPGIAQIYDAGTIVDELGVEMPYFAMEFIEGLPLTEYAARGNLGTRDRLELLARVCDAVYHAHQKGVIHRDLKPGNILVDTSGQPKVLDFGVARATDSDMQQTTLNTDVGQVIGTVPYMSPEQVSGHPEDLDTRSDVYALGVVAYELLAGRLPFDLARKLLHEAARIIREDEPTRLSSINRTLRGDVETIVAKALEKDKGRRYPSAESLGSDIRRYLRDEPITARPPTTWYQLAKFSRRHKGLVAGLVAAFALLASGVLGTGLALRRALRAESSLSEQLVQTERARKRAEATSAFVASALRSSDPNQDGSQSTTILGAMEAALKDIDSGRFKDDPETEADLRNTIGAILLGNGQIQGAEPQIERALALRQNLHPGDHADVAQGLNDLGMVKDALGDASGAERAFAQALDMNRRLHPTDHADTATSMSNLAQVRVELGDNANAEPLYAAALAMHERLYAGDHTSVATSLNNLATVRVAMRHYAEAQPLMARALDMYRRLHPGDHPDTANTLSNLASVEVMLGRTSDAEPKLAEALDMFRRVFKGDHPDIAHTLGELGVAREVLSGPGSSEPIFAQALEMYQRLLEGDHPEIARCLDDLGRAKLALGRAADAEPLFEQALNMRRRLVKGDHPDTVRALNGLATARLALGKIPEARTLAEKALEMGKRILPPDHPTLAKCQDTLERCEQALKTMP